MTCSWCPAHGWDWVFSVVFGIIASKLQNQAHKTSSHENTSSEVSNQSFKSKFLELLNSWIKIDTNTIQIRQWLQDKILRVMVHKNKQNLKIKHINPKITSQTCKHD